jgi:hypothetical protein
MTTFEKLMQLRCELAYLAGCEASISLVEKDGTIVKNEGSGSRFNQMACRIRENFLKQEGHVDIYDLPEEGLEILDFKYWPEQNVWMFPIWLTPFLPEYIEGVGFSVKNDELVREKARWNTWSIFSDYLQGIPSFGIEAKATKSNN